jgi:hypothetical protein
MGAHLGRRTFLKLVAAGGAAASFPGCRGTGLLMGEGQARFLRAHERETLEALAAAIVPEDETVGALGANAVEYIDLFLAAFENAVPTIYRGGPFSSRAPYPDPETGQPSHLYPPNAFRELLPLTRLQDAAFRILLYGSDSVPGGDINDPLVPRWPGLRTIYREGLANLQASAAETPGGFASLPPQARLDAFDATTDDFRSAVLAHLAEGMFCVPEYGGNPGGVAWRDYLYDGDSQPLGYTLYDRKNQTLRDRADRPNQTLDPRLPGDGFSPEVVETLTALVNAVGGRRHY